MTESVSQSDDTRPLEGPTALLAGRYALREQIGRGGVGVVWRATDTELGRDVAVKTIALDAADDSGAGRRLQREAQAAANLNHANIVRVYDTGTDHGTAYLVMELLEGSSGAELVTARRGLPVAQALDVVTQATAGVAAAHAAGLIHRDLKPANLMVTPHGVKVLDFGVARWLEHTASTLTSAGVFLGTAAYVSPEQARGDDADERSDVYALGCTLFALLAGHAPYQAEHPMGVLMQHIDAPVPSVRNDHPEVPVGVDALVSSAMAKDPRDRPVDAADLHAHLLAVLDGRAVERPGPAPSGHRGPPSRPRGRVLAVVGCGALLLSLTAWGTTQLGTGPLGLHAEPIVATPPSQPANPVDLPTSTETEGDLGAPADGPDAPEAPVTEDAVVVPADMATGTTTDDLTAGVPADPGPTGGPTTAPTTEATPEPTTEPSPSSPEPPDDGAAFAGAVGSLRDLIASTPFAERPQQARSHLTNALDAVVHWTEQGRAGNARAALADLYALVDEYESAGRIDGGAAAALRGAVADLEGAVKA